MPAPASAGKFRIPVVREEPERCKGLPWGFLPRLPTHNAPDSDAGQPLLTGWQTGTPGVVLGPGFAIL
jgi:hypothetical protein